MMGGKLVGSRLATSRISSFVSFVVPEFRFMNSGSHPQGMPLTSPAEKRNIYIFIFRDIFRYAIMLLSSDD